MQKTPAVALSRTRVLLVLLGAVLASLLAPPLADRAAAAPTLPAGRAVSADLRVLSGGQLRTVRLYLPAQVRRPAPLVVALHGYSQTLATAQQQQGWQRLADRHGFAVAWGVGESSWNAGTCCGRSVPARRDDVSYLDAAIATVKAVHPVDARRVHLVGYSNGAMMAFRYACERPQGVASVVGVAGTLTSGCPRRPGVPVMTVNGSADGLVPLRGTAWSAMLRTSLRPVSSVHAALGTPQRNRMVVLRGHGHGWPTTARGRYDATGQAWAFFRHRPRRS